MLEALNQTRKRRTKVSLPFSFKVLQFSFFPKKSSKAFRKFPKKYRWELRVTSRSRSRQKFFLRARSAVVARLLCNCTLSSFKKEERSQPQRRKKIFFFWRNAITKKQEATGSKSQRRGGIPSWGENPVGSICFFQEKWAREKKARKFFVLFEVFDVFQWFCVEVKFPPNLTKK